MLISFVCSEAVSLFVSAPFFSSVFLLCFTVLMAAGKFRGHSGQTTEPEAAEPKALALSLALNVVVS